jgi:hypothetical protein
MARWTTLAIASVAFGLAAAQPAFSQDGWITLFDGKNLDQWQGDGSATFKIEDGSVIAVDKKDPKVPSAFLVSRQSFRDFELRVEFWVSEDANSGIFIRNGDPKVIGTSTGYEVNVFDKRPDPTYGTGAIVNVAKVVVPITVGGKWNTFEIIAKGPKFTVTLNGVKTVDGAENADHPSGPIALQFGVGTVKFRKVQIRPL